MNEDGRERVRELIEESAASEYGPSRVASAEVAVRAADRLGDEDLCYESRMELLASTIFGGYPEKAMVAFSWLVSASDRSPQRFPESASVAGLYLERVDLLWAYKWVVQNTYGFPQITRAHIDRTLSDMETRFRKNGASLRPVWMNRARVGHALDGPGPQSEEFFERWMEAKRDVYADCPACEQHFQVEHHLRNEDLDEALTAARPLLRGEISCAEVPHMTFVKLVMPLARAGQLERAERCFARGYELCRNNLDFLEELAELVEFALWKDDIELARGLFRNHVEWVSQSRVGARQLRWFVVGGLLCERLSQVGGTLDVRLPAALGPASAVDDNLLECAAALAVSADQIADAFDQRNGNALVSAQVAQIRDELRARAGAK